MKYEIKPLQIKLFVKHLNELLEIERKVQIMFAKLYATDDWGEKEFLYELPEKFNLSFGVFNGSNLIGFSVAYAFTSHYAHISRVAIHPAYHAKGLGKRLLVTQLDAMTGFSFHKCSIDLVEKNERALKIYEMLGFERLYGDLLKEYVSVKNRERSEYFGDDKMHIALVKEF